MSKPIKKAYMVWSIEDDETRAYYPTHVFSSSCKEARKEAFKTILNGYSYLSIRVKRTPEEDLYSYKGEVLTSDEINAIKLGESHKKNEGFYAKALP